MKAIKDFIEMMDEEYETAKNFYGDSTLTVENRFYWAKKMDAFEEIIQSLEYKALKAASEQKIVVTDEIINTAINAYSTELTKSIPVMHDCMRTALEAAFDHIREGAEMVSSKKQIAVTDEMVSLANKVILETNGNFTISVRAALEAVFALATQQDTDNQEKSSKSDNPVMEKKPLDDGWIAWSGYDSKEKCRPLFGVSSIQVKFRTGAISGIGAPNDFKWLWHDDCNNNKDIIAYRIIDTPEEKPKKQTIEEFCTRNAPYNELDNLTPAMAIMLISEYFRGK